MTYSSNLSFFMFVVKITAVIEKKIALIPLVYYMTLCRNLIVPYLSFNCVHMFGTRLSSSSKVL